MDMREVLEAMRINGLHDEAAAVGIVMQQRAELMEALKVVLPIATKSNSLSVKDYNKAAQAITRAAAEIGKAMP